MAPLKNADNVMKNIFYAGKKSQEAIERNIANLTQKSKNIFGMEENHTPKKNNIFDRFNPFLDENGELVNPFINYQKLLDNSGISQNVKAYITAATGLSPKSYTNDTAESFEPVKFNPNLQSNNLATLDVVSELPKLTENQIADIISKHFSKSTVISPSDAAGIYKAQEESGMSALAILSIGALESGYGTSNIAKQKNNIWGWGAVNSNPSEAAKSFSQMSQGASEFANSFMKTYYNNYGAKSIMSAGTGNNPAQKGYAYRDDGSIETEWASKVGNIMGTFYNTAKNTSQSTQQATQSTSNNDSTIAKSVGKRVANTDTYNNDAAKGQCVWYVRGRANEKLGKNIGAMGNGNEMWYNAKDSAKVEAKPENLRANMIVSYKYGTSSAGQKYGHVIYIEDVVGDTVYYTEGGSGYYKNRTDGVVKTATRQGIINGVNNSGGRMGSQAIGFIDLSKY